MNNRKRKLPHKLLWYTTAHLFVLAALCSPLTLFAQANPKGYYTPKSLHIPLHDQKNQLHISLGRGGGYDLNLSYAFTDRLAVFQTATFDNGSKRRVTGLGDGYNVKRNDYVLKGGLGYFTRTKLSWAPVVEAYVGAGFSKIDNYWYFNGHSESKDVTQAKYWSVFGQINAGKKYKKSEYSYGIRLTYSRYVDFNFYGTHPYISYNKERYENLWGLSADPVVS